MGELGSNIRRFVVNRDGRALIQKRTGDNRVFLYDGNRAHLLAHPQTASVLPVRVYFGEYDRLQMISPDGVYRYEDDAWKKLYSHSFRLGSNAELVSSGDGRFWIGGRGGILEFDDQGIIQHSLGSEESSRVLGLSFSNDGTLWAVFGPSGDVYKCPRINGTLSPSSEWELIRKSEHEFVHLASILATRDDKIWVVNNHEYDGAHIYDLKKGTWEMQNLRSQGGENYNTTLMESHDGRVWVAGRGSLHVYDDQGWSIYKAPRYPVPDARPILSQDSRGFVYLIEAGADIIRLDYSQRHYRGLLGLHFQAEDRDGNFWYLDVEGHVVMEDRETSEWIQFLSSTTGVQDPVTLLTLENGHVLCAGSDSEAAAFAIYDGNEWQQYRFPEFALGFSPNGVLKLKSGEVILSCGQPQSGYPNIQGGMLRLKYSRGKYTVDHHDIIHAPFRPWTIAEDPVNNFIWAGSNELQIVDFRIPLQTIEFPGRNWIDMLTVTENGDLWMALWGSGVFQRTAGEWIDRSNDNLLTDLRYSYIIAFNGTDPVVATDQGIYRFKDENWAVFASPALSFHRGGGSLKQSRDGSLWVNTTHTDWYYRGLKKEPYPDVKKEIFGTVQCIPDTHAPHTVIRNQEVTVFSDQKASFSWYGVDHWSKTPRRNHTYSISIDGGPWSPFSSENRLERFDWSDGKHTLSVRARDSDFNIQAVPAVHSFEIILPIWRKTWAQVAFVLIVLSFFVLVGMVVRQRYRHLLELERIKLHFFTNISHELRTPLSLILGPVEKLLTSKKTDSENHSYLRTIQTNTSRLLYLIDQLLDFRRVEQGRLVSEPQEIDLVVLTRNVIETYDFVVTEKNQKLTFSTPFKNCTLVLDSDIYYKVLDNLIHNAIKYTQPGGTIQVSLNYPTGINDPAMVDHLVLCVEDNGQGLSKELVDKVFEPFHRGSQEPGKMKEGVGIGLALVKELVDFVHGKISVVSPVPLKQAGSRFTVEFPVKDLKVEMEGDPITQPQPDRVDPSTDPDDEDTMAVRKRTHIHLVEDNPDVLDFLRTELSESYEVTVSEDGLAAEEFILENVPDLVITDVMMPKQDGFELCKHLKTNPVTSHVPVIMLTAFKTPHHEEEGLSLGADDYIAKPVSMRLLNLKIGNLLAQQERLREKIRLDYGLLPASESKIRAVDKAFLDNAEAVAVRCLGDEFFGVEQFAQEMGMGRSSFYKKFRDLTGLSPAAYVKVKRLTESARRIEEGEGNITEIAFDVGFSDVSYFSRCFREHFGCPPSKYLSQQAQNREQLN